MDQNGINNLASSILDFTTGIAKSKVDNAQYDKSFNTVIWGINQLFTDDVPQSVQEKLIKEHKIPETSENYFYTFAIDGNYYVKESDNKFKLYQDVVVRVPNGNWDMMYIEGNGSDKETINDSLFPLKDIKISTGKIEYNGEVYRLQRGNDRKIIAISQGEKCTRIYATTEAESEAAVISAVIHGLDEPWDIEFDYFVSGDGLGVTPFIAGVTKLNFSESGDLITEVDYGDGSEIVTSYSGESHTIEHKGYYHMRIKTTATKLARFGGCSLSDWDMGKEVNPKKWRSGQHVYIGGNIKSVEHIYGNVISHLTWGESVNYIDSSAFLGSDSPIGFIDVGLPPYFISSIEKFNVVPESGNGMHQILYGSPVNYLYIPESCRRIFHSGFGNMSLKTLEIESAGESLKLDPGAFLQYYNSPLKAISIPARVKFSTNTTNPYSPFDGAGIRVIHLQRGVQEIVAGSFLDCNSADPFSIGNSVILSGGGGEVYIFIPKTVAAIRYRSFQFYSTSIINVIYEGTPSEWNEVNKEVDWLSGREAPDNIVFGETYYNSFDTVVANLRDKYASGVGIEVSDAINLKAATKNTLGGVKAGKSGSGIENISGNLSLEKADLSTFGGLRLGKGLYPSPTDSHGYGIVDVNLGKGLVFVEQDESESSTEKDGTEDSIKEFYSAIEVKIGEGLKFGENGELIATVTGGKEYKAGQNISISEDGTISATGSNADLAPGGGITIETEEETGKQTISAAVGEGAEIRDGKICTVPNIQNAVFLSEKDAKYLLHDFTQVEYIAGNQIGYAGGQNQIVIQGLISYKEGGIAPNGTTVAVKSNTTNELDIPDVPTYTEICFDPPVKFGTNEEFVKIKLRPFSFSTTYYILKIFGVKEDGTEMQIGNSGGYNNYDNFSPGLALVWKTITPPGESDFGSATVTLFLKHKASATAYRFIAAGQNFTIKFASLAEYQAAIGLTYEPLTLTEVTDNPTVVSGKDIE